MKEKVHEQREQERRKLELWIKLALYEALEELAEHRGKDIQEYAQEILEIAIQRAYLRYVIGW